MCMFVWFGSKRKSFGFRTVGSRNYIMFRQVIEITCGATSDDKVEVKVVSG